MSIQYKYFDTDNGKEPSVRIRFEDDELVEFTLTATEANHFKQLPLLGVSTKFFDSPDFWESIADVNPIKPPWEWKAGDTVLLPRNFLDAFVPQAQDDSLNRRIF